MMNLSHSRSDECKLQVGDELVNRFIIYPEEEVLNTVKCREDAPAREEHSLHMSLHVYVLIQCKFV